MTPQLQQLLSAAGAARQAGRADDERRLLDEALAAAPADPAVNNARGMRALLDRDYALAEARFLAATAADPREPGLWMNVATARRGAGDDGGEEAALTRALEINQLNFMAQLRMAELHQRLGRGPQAAQSWANVVQMAAGMPERPPVVVEAMSRGQAYLAEHGRKLAADIDANLGAAMAAAGAEARRFAACMDVLLGKRTIYRNECAGIHYPFLPADEFFEKRHFPWLAAIEAKTDVIRAEALALIERGGDAIRPYVRQDKGTPENKWTALDGSLDWSAIFLWEYGEPNEAVCRLCPETAAALDALPRNRIPGKAPSAFFSLLKPRTKIPPHTGVTNTRAIIHLPLVVPPHCRFRVGGETREWVEGEAFAFDDTIEHEAINDSDEPRLVLIFDTWNPHLTPVEQELLVKFFAMSPENLRF